MINYKTMAGRCLKSCSTSKRSSRTAIKSHSKKTKDAFNKPNINNLTAIKGDYQLTRDRPQPINKRQQRRGDQRPLIQILLNPKLIAVLWPVQRLVHVLWFIISLSFSLWISIPLTKDMLLMKQKSHQRDQEQVLPEQPCDAFILSMSCGFLFSLAKG